jgi:O-antigen/teichoic acid export membrane protein
MGYLKKTVVGVSWMALGRISVRALSFGKTIIIARILMPAQFGLFGIASIALSFLEVFTETGVNVFLIQERTKLKNYVDTAWTISIVRGLLLSIVIFLSAPLIDKFFSFGGSVGILRLISIVPLIRGFINPAEIKFQKKLQFDKEFFLRTSVFATETIVAVFYALIHKTPESLVWGMIIGASVEVVISNLLIKPSPKLRLDMCKAKKILDRGKWVTLSGIVHHLNLEGDDAVVAKILGETPLGLYSLAYKLASLPLTEVTQVAGKVAFPVFSRISGDKYRLKKAFVRSFVLSYLFVIPIGAVLFLFPRQIVELLLGANWVEASDVLRILALFGFIRAAYAIPNSLLYSLKRQEWIARILSVQLFTLALTIVPLTLSYGIVGAGIASTSAVMTPLPIFLYYLRKVL